MFPVKLVEGEHLKRKSRKNLPRMPGLPLSGSLKSQKCYVCRFSASEIAGGCEALDVTIKEGPLSMCKVFPQLALIAGGNGIGS